MVARPPVIKLKTLICHRGLKRSRQRRGGYRPVARLKIICNLFIIQVLCKWIPILIQASSKCLEQKTSLSNRPLNTSCHSFIPSVCSVPLNPDPNKWPQPSKYYRIRYRLFKSRRDLFNNRLIHRLIDPMVVEMLRIEKLRRGLEVVVVMDLGRDRQ